MRNDWQVRLESLNGTEKLKLIKSGRSMVKLVLMFYIFLWFKGSVPQPLSQNHVSYENVKLNLKIYIYYKQDLKVFEEAKEKCSQYGEGFGIAYEMRYTNIFEQVAKHIIDLDPYICTLGK